MDKQMDTGFNNVILSKHKYNRKHVKITHTPSAVENSQQLIINVPNLATNERYLPNTFKITFDVGNITNPPSDMLVSNIFEEIRYQINGNDVYVLNKAYIYNTYKDAWRSIKKIYS